MLLHWGKLEGGIAADARAGSDEGGSDNGAAALVNELGGVGERSAGEGDATAPEGPIGAPAPQRAAATHRATGMMTARTIWAIPLGL